MSDRQIAYAATAGRKVTFTSVQALHPPITGYVCGSDDYHWLVAYTDETSENVTTSLVHKGLAPTVTISPVSTLADEPPAIRAAIEGIGRGFWLFCDKTYFGKDGQVPEQSGTVSAFAKTASHHSPRQQESA